jgi:hypothetical protein
MTSVAAVAPAVTTPTIGTAETDVNRRTGIASIFLAEQCPANNDYQSDHDEHKPSVLKRHRRRCFQSHSPSPFDAGIPLSGFHEAMTK